MRWRGPWNISALVDHSERVRDYEMTRWWWWIIIGVAGVAGRHRSLQEQNSSLSLPFFILSLVAVTAQVITKLAVGQRKTASKVGSKTTTKTTKEEVANFEQ